MSKVRLEQRDAVSEIVLDAPKLNLFDLALVADLEQVLEDVRARAEAGETRAVLVRAEGSVFCGGVDVHEFRGLGQAAGAQLMARFLGLGALLESLPVPTVTAVHALNLTIGMEIALATDLLWAAEEASFGLVEPTVGLTPGAGGTQRLVARAGVARAAEFVLTGDIYPAREMYEWGVVNRLRPAATLLEDVRAFADRLAAGPTKAAAAGKALLKAARDHGTAVADARTPEVTGRVFATEDLPAGIESLLTNGPRKAVFRGR
ncbi:enoyl-CoA hydratase/isomerase family protein [Cryptosporangium aurantiacum]|uniref:Enoyl-CoA hydratase/carnithine racemase n=1 Tax=Cryptosporangium aurantiacum TaxID=134849 RepID=A0A1M7PJ25_9ACTN|nr:enoyl-CoA hydratase/isomerase family protein [Cryptosporangium aurantiacum]SHN16846.1 Enoyl-CoA hydratase/carnithine racemase [Cryptosporangium aurantiacum]